MMRFSHQLVDMVCNGRSLSSLVCAVLFRVPFIDPKDRTASPWMTDRPNIFFCVLPLVGLLELAVVALVDALRDPLRFKSRLSARASGGPPWVEAIDSRGNMRSDPTPVFSPF